MAVKQQICGGGGKLASINMRHSNFCFSLKSASK